MRRLVSFVRRHIDDWDTICLDDRARLRLNVILFTLVISIIYFVMGIRTAVVIGFSSGALTLLLGCVSLALFVWQFLRRAYSMLIAWLFGVMSFAMAAYFVGSGGLQNTGHVWICVLPIVGTMMVPLASTLIYNGLLIALLACMMQPPLYNYIPADYGPYFRVVFPISIVILTLCNYVAEYTRQRTQKQLVVMTEKLRDSAFTDPLTHAYNRRALTAHFGDAHESAHGLSFAMLDLDHFKAVNDTYGHEVGDRLLVHLVALIRQCMPAGAYLYRWGGEEFLLVLKSSDEHRLMQLLEGIRETVEHTPLELPATDDGVVVRVAATVSIGGVTAAPGDDIEHSISVADERMYRAKHTGRNRVVAA